jgi:hypothetical protein
MLFVVLNVESGMSPIIVVCRRSKGGKVLSRSRLYHVINHVAVIKCLSHPSLLSRGWQC